MSNSKILSFRVEADTRRAITEVNAFTGAIANIGYIAPGQARSLKSINAATVANAKASKDAAAALLSMARARVAQTVADDRAAGVTLKLARVNGVADKEAAKAATEKQKNSRTVTVAFDRETRAIEDGARRQVAAAKTAASGYDNLAKKSQKSFDEVRRQIRATDAEMSRAAAKRKVNGERIATGANVVGGALTAGVTAPLVAAGAYSLSTAIDWEASFAEVKKFVGGSTSELAKLRADLRGLALDAKTGLSFTEAAHLAAFGGQLGVARENLTDFVRQVSYLGQAGDLSGEEAATGIAKISAALKLPASDFAHLASALAAMGSVGSSTVRQILDVTQRIASAGRVAGMTAPQLLAVANAMISLGQEPEAAATAFQSVVDKIGRAVSGTTKTLPEFARIAGMSTRDFASAYRKDALGAVLAFVAGLDKMPPKSGAAGRALDALGITQVRQRTAVLNLAAGHETLSAALKTATDAYTGHNVAEEKAATAAGTTKRELETLTHEVQDAANDLGEALIPALRDALKETKPLRDGVKSLAQTFHDMTPEAQSAWTRVAFVAAIAGPTILALAGIAEAVGKLRAAYIAMKGAAAGAGIEGALLRGAGAMAKGVAGGAVLAAPFIYAEEQTKATLKENIKTDQNTINDAALPGFLQTAQARGDVAQKISQLRERIKKIGTGPYTDTLNAQLAELEKEEAGLGKVYDSQRATYFKNRPSLKPVTPKKDAKTAPKKNGDGAPILTEAQKREAERKRNEAEAAQKKADLDVNAADKEFLTGKLTGLNKSYSTTLETLRNDATPGQLPFLKKKLASLSSQILETATQVADNELAQARISDPKNTRAATARNATAHSGVVIAGGDRATDIGKAVTEAYKRSRSVTHEEVSAKRQADIETKQNNVSVLEKTLSETMSSVSENGISQESVPGFLKVVGELSEAVAKLKKEIADISYTEQTALGGAGSKILATAKRDIAYGQADIGIADTVTEVDKLLPDARKKSMDDAENAAKGVATTAKNALDALKEFLDSGITSLETLNRYYEIAEPKTLSEVAAGSARDAAIRDRRKEAAGVGFQEMGLRFLNPSLGDPMESFNAAIDALNKADMEFAEAATKRVEQTIELQEKAAESFLLTAKTDPRRKVRGQAFFEANKRFDEARAVATTQEQRDKVTAYQSDAIVSAASMTKSRLDLQFAIQKTVTLLTEAIDKGNNTLADTLTKNLETLETKLEETERKFKRYNAKDFGKAAGSVLSGGARDALYSVVDNGTNGKGLSSSLSNIGKETGKNLIKAGIDGIMTNIENDLQNTVKKAGQSLAKEATKFLSQAGPEIGASIGIAAIGVMNVLSKKSKKKTNSIIGGVLGAVAGGVLGGGNPLAISAGFSAGSMLGGAFAKGGVAPGRKVSLFGEMGPELGIPSSDMRILPADVTKALLSGTLNVNRDSGRGATVVHIDGPLQHIENVHDKTDAGYMAKMLSDNLADRLAASGH